MSTYMVVATFSPATDLPAMNTVIAEEVAQVDRLSAEGRLGSLHISPSRGAVFLEVHADDELAARATVQTLPMARWWDLDIFPLMTPQIPAA
jgi:muconolactone delta-isomerase